MKVFVTGGTGFIGSAIVAELLASGHQVLGLARSESSAQKLLAAGAQVHRGSIEDLASLQRGAAAAEGAIHTAFFHEISHPGFATRLRIVLGGAPRAIISRFLQAAVDTDRRAIETIGRALQGSDRAFVSAFGTMPMRAGELALEDNAPDRKSVGAARIPSEESTLALSTLGIRSSVIRLAPAVHGDNDRSGFMPRLIQIARKTGISAYMGTGQNRWPAVHRLDAARLFRLALENGEGGSRYHGVTESGIPFIEIAAAIGQALSVPVVEKTAAGAAKHFSWLSTFASVDNPASAP